MFLKSVLAAATVAVLTMTGCSSGSSPAAAPSTSAPSSPPPHPVATAATIVMSRRCETRGKKFWSETAVE